MTGVYKVTTSVEEIKFNKKYYYPIKDGVKTQTLRLARKRLDVQEGDVVTAVFKGCDKTLTIKIVKIGYKLMKSIDINDALNEGYAEVSELKNDLMKIYPTINRWDRLYYYKFEVIE